MDSIGHRPTSGPSVDFEVPRPSKRRARAQSRPGLQRSYLQPVASRHSDKPVAPLRRLGVHRSVIRRHVRLARQRRVGAPQWRCCRLRLVPIHQWSSVQQGRSLGRRGVARHERRAFDRPRSGAPRRTGRTHGGRVILSRARSGVFAPRVLALRLELVGSGIEALIQSRCCPGCSPRQRRRAVVGLEHCPVLLVPTGHG